MITSMTGFGRGSAEGQGGTIGVEVRSVNSRFLDIQVRSPQLLQAYEQAVRERVQKAVARGKVSVHISWEEGAQGASMPQLDEAVATRYVEEAQRIAAMEGVGGEVELSAIMRLPGVFKSGSIQDDAQECEALLYEALAAALEEFTTMREREGTSLAVDLRQRLDGIESLLLQIDASVPEAREQIVQRLRERIAELVKPGEFDEARLAMEVALIAERGDIPEEIVRFRSHNAQFIEALEQGGEVGRRFNFLLQEMNREANTITSKAANTPIVHAALEIKEEVERLREQVQNLA
jgi:uncharacterized protein (TIGR00255 family)